MGLGFASETLPSGENGGANGKKNRRKKIALLGATFRGNRQRHFLFDLFYRSALGAMPQALGHINEVVAAVISTPCQGLKPTGRDKLRADSVHDSPLGQRENQFKNTLDRKDLANFVEKRFLDRRCNR
jgi:hypothetical protein